MMGVNTMQIGLKIKKLREENNFSQTLLAKKIKTLNQSQICKIENGKRGVKVNEVSDIAKAFSVSISEIIT
jgi:transcriptional regulator with XRE-family HTH domain